MTLTDNILSGGTVRINAGFGRNNIDCSGDTAESTGSLLTFSDYGGNDLFAGGHENDTVEVRAVTVGSDTLTGGSGTNTLVLTTPDTANLAGVSHFQTINLPAGISAVTLTDNTLSGGSVTVSASRFGGHNTIDASADTVASTGAVLTYIGTIGRDMFRGGDENDTVQVAAAKVGGDVLTGGTGSNTLLLTTAGAPNLAHVSAFGTITLSDTGANAVSLSPGNFAGLSGRLTVNGGNAGNVIDASALSSSNVVALKGGAGDDIFKFSAAGLAASDAVVGAGGYDKLVITTAGKIAIGGVSGIDAYHLASSGANKLVLSNDNFAGVTGPQIQVFAGSAGDRLDASAVTTATNRAHLNGGAGNDILVAGVDTKMTGMGGSNEFVFSAPGTNVITDFGESAGNRLVVRNSWFDLGIDNGTGTTRPQHLDASLFTANAAGAFDNTNERFAYDTTNGKLFYSADGHSSTKELVATLSSHAPVSAGVMGNLFFTS